MPFAPVFFLRQVEGLSAEVVALKGQQGLSDGAPGVHEQFKQLSLSMDKRHSRVETAIYQVRLMRAGTAQTFQQPTEPLYHSLVCKGFACLPDGVTRCGRHVYADCLELSILHQDMWLRPHVWQLSC